MAHKHYHIYPNGRLAGVVLCSTTVYRRVQNALLGAPCKSGQNDRNNSRAPGIYRCLERKDRGIQCSGTSAGVRETSIYVDAARELGPFFCLSEEEYDVLHNCTGVFYSPGTGPGYAVRCPEINDKRRYGRRRIERPKTARVYECRGDAHGFCTRQPNSGGVSRRKSYTECKDPEIYDSHIRQIIMTDTSLSFCRE